MLRVGLLKITAASGRHTHLALQRTRYLTFVHPKDIYFWKVKGFIIFPFSELNVVFQHSLRIPGCSELLNFQNVTASNAFINICLKI